MLNLLFRPRTFPTTGLISNINESVCVPLSYKNFSNNMN